MVAWLKKGLRDVMVIIAKTNPSYEIPGKQISLNESSINKEVSTLSEMLGVKLVGFLGYFVY